jgi:hypothetical protein
LGEAETFAGQAPAKQFANGGSTTGHSTLESPVLDRLKLIRLEHDLQTDIAVGSLHLLNPEVSYS